MEISENIELAGLNTLGLNSIARWFCVARTEDNLRQAAEFANNRGVNLFPLGGGSNVVLLDDVDAVVVRVDLRELSFKDDIVVCGAGENWHETVVRCLQNSRRGLENLALIPGTVGAAPIQNIGAYGVELSSFVEYVRAFNSVSLQSRVFTPADCEFRYRDSFFKSASDWIVTQVALRLPGEMAPHVAYPGIEAYLTDNHLDVSAQHVFDAVVAIRQSKLPDPMIEPNVGSFFKNPIVSQSKLSELRRNDAAIPGYPLDDGQCKLSAGWLIEQAGLKGQSEGGFAVSEQHALVIINRGQGSVPDLKRLITRIQSGVESRFGIQLEPEPKLYPSA